MRYRCLCWDVFIVEFCSKHGKNTVLFLSAQFYEIAIKLLCVFLHFPWFWTILVYYKLTAIRPTPKNPISDEPYAIQKFSTSKIPIYCCAKERKDTYKNGFKKSISSNNKSIIFQKKKKILPSKKASSIQFGNIENDKYSCKGWKNPMYTCCSAKKKQKKKNIPQRIHIGSTKKASGSKLSSLILGSIILVIKTWSTL